MSIRFASVSTDTRNAFANGIRISSPASDFTGRLDLYDGVLTESGGGMTLKAWVNARQDMLIVDVTGANPATTQTASVNLWSGRTPTAGRFRPALTGGRPAATSD